MTEERRRLDEATRRVAHWRRWGPYLSERQWGTVREDYSPGGTAWEYFPHDHARSRAYRWGEDGLAGISDNHQRLCFALALWNGRDAILKERLFGLTGTQGNHGEDVKEYYFYLDNTPTHAYMKYLYKYPQRAFPYALLLEETARRDRRAREYELLDTGVFDDDRYFDVVVEYAKAAIDGMLIRIAVTNRGPEPADVHVLPTLWFRNTWTWGAGSPRPRLRATAPGGGGIVIEAEHATLGRRWLVGEGAADLLFTENETNARRLWGVANTTLYVKDAFHDYVVHGRADAVNPAAVGTKAAAHHRWSLRAGETRTLRLRLSDVAPDADPFGRAFDALFERRRREADEFYATVVPATCSADARAVARQAWAVWRVYKIDRRVTGVADRDFLEKAFQKLLLNFTWWVNRKDTEDKNVFEGGFLGLDNIGVFDRSAPLPTGGRIEQSDGTSWMGMYCLNMLAIALELSQSNPAYEDIASKFFEHFVYIARAMNDLGGEGLTLWDEADGFYYDVLHTDREIRQLKVRSMVGLIPLFAVETLEPDVVDRLPGFMRRLQWFVDNRPQFRANLDTQTVAGGGVRRLLSIVNRTQLTRVLRYMLDRDEFLSPHGIRALSRYHRAHPYVLTVDGVEHRVGYEPAESTTALFGGNSNWRGPLWFPMNYLLIESLQKFHHFYGDDLKVECPSGSHRRLNLWDVAGELSRGLVRLFLRGRDGRRPVHGDTEKFQSDPYWRDLLLFYEYFHGDDGAGLGASHQTGWTGLVAKLMQQSGE